MHIIYISEIGREVTAQQVSLRPPLPRGYGPSPPSFRPTPPDPPRCHTPAYSPPHYRSSSTTRHSCEPPRGRRPSLTACPVWCQMPECCQGFPCRCLCHKCHCSHSLIRTRSERYSVCAYCEYFCIMYCKLFLSHVKHLGISLYRYVCHNSDTMWSNIPQATYIGFWNANYRKLTIYKCRTGELGPVVS